ncbi:MAG: DNA primase [Clostridia bacterium]|nr:DNA primase [Clostridia bacterium]
MIPKEVIEEVVSRTDIVQLISGYVTLRRAGSNMVGLCPFHSERTPSFTVFPGSNSFFCFGCSAGGDAITFVRRAENLDYPDAVEFLAKRVGVTVIDTDVHETRSRFDRKRLLEMNREAAHFFHSSLFADTPDAAEAREYLMGKRALSSATVKHFGLGYAPPDYYALTPHLLSLGYTEDELLAAALSRKSEKNGKLYDYFRGRVMFPIIDVQGNVIAFGGRVLDDSKPKYLNTSDTPVFKKHRNLFALNFARGECSERLILCEGYMDVIALHAAGFPQAVATLGTAITPDQARIMSRYSKKVVISYDMDQAGRLAADKATKLLEEVGVEVTLLKLPGGKDPDEFIRNSGPDAFQKVLEGSQSKFDYTLDRTLSKYDLSDPQQKIQALAELRASIAGFASSSEREVYIGVVADKFSIPAKSLREDVDRLIARQRREFKKKEGDALRQSITGFQDRINPEFSRTPGVARTEETVLGLLLLDPNYRAMIHRDEPILTENDFLTEFSRRVFCAVRDRIGDGEWEISALNEDFSPEEIGRIFGMRNRRMQLSDNGDKLFSDCVAALKEAVAKERLSQSDDPMAALQQVLQNKRKDT